MSVSRHKCVLLIVDGMGDLPVPELDGKTPLEAAHTPVLDHLAGRGRYGLVDPIGPGVIPNTHTGTGMLMGLLPEQAHRLSRGSAEAAGAGCVLASGDVAMRSNFATLEHRGDEFLVLDRRAGRITSKTDELAALLRNIDLGDDIRANLFSTDQHRGVLVLSGPGLDASISNTDPGDCPMPTALKVCAGTGTKAEFTASKVNRFVDEAHRRLASHPINLDRVREGRLPANGIITRGAGQRLHLDNALRDLQVRAAVVSGCNTVLGLGRLFDFDTFTNPCFTAALDTDLDAKIDAVLKALHEHDMVFVHIKAPDICSHDLQPLAKRDFMQRVDEAMAPLKDAGLVVAVAADHSTDSNTGFHTADPVPALIYHPDSTQAITPVKFGEAACTQGNMERQGSHEFLLKVLQLTTQQLA